ncbi:unnamed protein product [Cylindrotheca closterium]|uniref:Uncharacterized protein n=1 Tax=Cylindrotheca closterium TaxID=2856 RepID=A0AAD2D0L5_9STRA|nr:unnamed protein product [Cylindrotheca closterium]
MLCAHERSPSVSSHGSLNSTPIVKEWRKRRSIPDLLAGRQTYGKRGRFGKQMGIPHDLLSYRTAWNRSRLQNMILAVGPGTPAALVMGHGPLHAQASVSTSSSSSSSAEAEPDLSGSEESLEEDTRERNEEGADGDGDDTGGENEAAGGSRARWTRQRRTQSDSDESGEDGTQQFVNAAFRRFYGEDSSSSEDEEEVQQNGICMEPKYAPSMRHGGCINTATWMDCGWRISTAGSCNEPVKTMDCPTQLVTSGDDHLVKFWDVREAMGSTTPLAGGVTTMCPFAQSHYCPGNNATDEWSRYFNATGRISGAVLPLATIRTGHYNNVFHVTPMATPGKVATCGADGYLRVADLQSAESSVIVSPEFDEELSDMLPAGFLSIRSPMCFSHHFLSDHTGLLCSERGLRRFDIRVPPRAQPSRSLLGRRYRVCKAFAVLSSPVTTSSLEEGDSVYVFAGGSSSDITLFDLRMTDASAANRVVQVYRPSSLTPLQDVSVSGIDLSRDRKELLVSYESDQIYTFPVFPRNGKGLGPTIDELRDMPVERSSGQNAPLRELASYGAHLNRFTFLKNARYAGPRDEYICTGSDSGHAWIYEKATGSVVSFLNADNSTCNGIVPHPSLPLFITYGIDSTAKLWRATTPIDSEIDDSPSGRLDVYHKSHYEMSPIVRKWNEIQPLLKVLFEEPGFESKDILPDSIPGAKERKEADMYGSRGGFRRHGGQPRICNDMQNLTKVVKLNLYSCIKSRVDGEDDVPVESDLDALQHRVCMIRQRHQADTMGLPWNPNIPWRLDSAEGLDVHPADLIPQSPSDWILHDSDMHRSQMGQHEYFNAKQYEDFYCLRYSNLEDIEPFSRGPLVQPGSIHVGDVNLSRKDEQNDDKTTGDKPKKRKEHKAKITDAARASGSEDAEIASIDDGNESEQTDSTAPTCKMNQSSFENNKDDLAHNQLYQTMLLLKDAGNEALEARNFDTAARRYDTGIQYGAVACMCYPTLKVIFSDEAGKEMRANGWLHLEWTPTVRLLIVLRLNHALVMLKPYFAQPHHAVEQSRLALLELRPFCTKKGKIMKGPKMTEVYREDEPEDTFLDAIKLQAKAFFRMGCAHYEMGEYREAIRAFENSVKSTQLSGADTDKGVLRRLTNAKREYKRTRKQQKRFKLSFAPGDEESEDDSSC